MKKRKTTAKEVETVVASISSSTTDYALIPPDSSSVKMSPRVALGDSPPFHEMGEYQFQKLCRDLLDAEPHISTCHIYGVRGQRQDGIDLRAYRRDGRGIEVAQCKCCKDFSRSHIEDASQEFFDHWDHWGPQNVRRFVLLVACDLDRREQQDAIEEQRVKFGEVDITYEAWSAATIRNRLRTQPGIVATHLAPPEYWVSLICGQTMAGLQVSQGTSTPSVLTLALATYAEQVAPIVADATQQGLESMWEGWREGRDSEARAWVISQKGNSAVWQSLPPQTRSRILCFEAALELGTTGDFTETERLLSQEEVVVASGSEYVRLRILVERWRGGPEAALRAIEFSELRSDIRIRNLKASLLLETGRASECVATLSECDAGSNGDIGVRAEMHRIRALAHIMNGDIDQARNEAQNAMQLKPRWESTRLASGIIGYLSSLSPAIVPKRLPQWPEPVDWDLVRRDDETRARLRAAADLFRGLADSPDKGKEERDIFESWYLACLLNDMERQELAGEHCRKILQANPTHYGAITWTAVRKLNVNLMPSEKAIQTMVGQHMATVPHIIALLACYVVSNRVPKAERLLKQTRVVFESEGEQALWAVWNTQLLVLKGKSSQALAAIRKAKHEVDLGHVRTMALRALARENDSWDELLAHLNTVYQTTQDPLCLMEMCQVNAHLRNWNYVADRGNDLVRLICTGEALKLATIATYNAGRFDDCIALMDNHRDLFSGRILPSDLRRLRILCQRRRGILSKAVVDAEALAKEDPKLDNLMALAEVYFSKGDLRGLAAVARKIVVQDELQPEQALRISQWVQLEDLYVARSLWRRAESQGISDDMVGAAVALGHQLGLDSDLGQLIARMQKLGSANLGGIQQKKLSDLLLDMEQRRKDIGDVQRLYRDGELPIHVIADHLNTPLAVPYHDRIEDDGDSPCPAKRLPLFIRHGGRLVDSNAVGALSPGVLYLDVTAILLAEHLGILDEVQRAFKPLHIPAELIPALIDMQRRLLHQQPLVLEAKNQVIDLLERGLLNVEGHKVPAERADPTLSGQLGEDTFALLQRATETDTGGHILAFLPLTNLLDGIGLVALPAEYERYLVNCRAVLEALRAQGPLSAEYYAQSLRNLGIEGSKDPVGPLLVEGSQLWCNTGLAEFLARVGLLRIACEHFKVFIHEEELKRIQGELKNNEHSTKLAQWVERLAKKLSIGVEDGTYQILPQQDDRDTDSSATSPLGPATRCLHSLISFQPSEGDIIWVDDRYVNGFMNMKQNSARIVGISEILGWLVGAGVIDRAGYYAKLTRLRRANLMFLPLDCGEVLHHLRQATIKDGAVVETEELANLRRYVAACILQEDAVQRPPMPDGASNPNGELAFLLDVGRVTSNALTELWNASAESREVRQAWAQWIVTGLYIDHLPLLLQGPSSREYHKASLVVASSLAGLISQALALSTHVEGHGSYARKDYLEWLFDGVLWPRFDANPHLLSATTELLKKLLHAARQDMIGTSSEYALARILQAFYLDLPTPVREELQRDTDFMADIGLTLITAVTVDDLSFAPADFWLAASEAVNGREATINPIRTDISVTFRSSDSGALSNHFYYIDPRNGKRVDIRNDELLVLLDSAKQRQEALRQHRDWFDCSQAGMDRAVAEISSLEDPQQRIAEVRLRRESSAAVFYADLSRRLGSQRQFRNPDLLLSTPEGLLRHFRLSPDTVKRQGFTEAIAEATRCIIAEEGIQSAVERLASLPMPLPTPLAEAISLLSPNERRGLIRNLLRVANSPLSRLHFIRILLDSSVDSKAYPKLARRSISSLLGDEGTQAVNAFLAILKWVNEQLGKSSEVRSWPACLRLAMTWGHTHRLFTIFMENDVSIPWLLEHFRGSSQLVSEEFFERSPGYWFDVAHPGRVNHRTFILSSLAYAVGKEHAGSLSGRLQDTVAGLAWVQTDRGLLPYQELLTDYTQANDSLGTFLSGDWGEKLSGLLSLPDTAKLSARSLRVELEQSIKGRNQADGRLSAWGFLALVLGGLPPYEDLADDIRAMCLELDLAALVNRDRLEACIAIHTASGQAVHLGSEEVCRHLADELVSGARLLSTLLPGGCVPQKDRIEDPERIGVLLLESAFTLSLAEQESSDARAARFADYLTKLIEHWSVIVPLARPVVERLCQGLPTAHARYFWPLLVRLRAH